MYEGWASLGAQAPKDPRVEAGAGQQPGSVGGLSWGEGRALLASSRERDPQGLALGVLAGLEKLRVLC